MPKRSPKRLVLPLLSALHGAAFAAEGVVAGAPAACLADLEDAARYIAANDAGAPGLLADHEGAITRAFDKARADIAAAPSLDDMRCGKILQTYLRAWRPGHLNVRPKATDNAAAGGKPASSAAQSNASSVA